MDEFDRADVESAGRLYGNQKVGILVNFTGNDRLLLVSAGHASGCGDGTLSAADIVLIDQLIRVGADIIAAEETGLICEFRLKIPLQYQIVFQRII